MPEIVWEPPPDLVAGSNIGRFMAAHEVADFGDLVRRSIDEPEWFWDAVVEFLGLVWTTPYDPVLDTSDGIEWARWFTGGTLNLAHNCVDRHAQAPTTASQPAVVWEGEDGATRTLTYRELQTLVDRIATALAARGIGAGDAVGIYLP